tara:strand:+ start:2267 stop:2824 length:558 start_codon:yes stop_codon:yes gene_type:complete
MSEEEVEKETTAPSIPPEARVMGLFQEIDESKAEEIIYALKLYQIESGDEIEFLISSPGGVAADMFAIYDFMRITKTKAPISTYGIGKVMSAAVLLLAAGTKGHRKVGKNCRIMIHSIIAGSSGAINDLKNEMKEIQKIQDMYIDALAKETKLTKKKLKDLFSKNVNVYLSAEEAVEYGIADIIV